MLRAYIYLGATGFGASWSGVPITIVQRPVYAPSLDLNLFYESLPGEGSTVDVSQANGHPADYTYFWTLNTVAMTPPDSSKPWQYPINGVSSNEGTWAVTVNNAAGSATAQFEYRVFVDADNDGLSNYQESNLTNTDPNDADSDNDGLTDGAEVNSHTTDPNDADSDNDGLSDGAEVNSHTTDPNDADSDNDGLTDGAEVNSHTTDPNDADSDNDGLSDGAEVNIHETDPKMADSDGDALSDAVEINTLGTNPNLQDSDGDTLVDADEISLGTDPLDADTSNDGFSDGALYDAGLSPTVDHRLLTSAIQSQVQDARPGSIVLQTGANNAVTLQLQIQRSDDLSTWTSSSDDLVEVELPMQQGKGFFRFAMPQE